jgi:hypothetical protein
MVPHVGIHVVIYMYPTPFIQETNKDMSPWCAN